ncbi:hypothetical protein [Parvularcula sp. IMCC14364]|uniref:hypothetical protein n=1 Tax=Parvularcula sp. IMCC14364 TaxID=3067902 RepID=UPI002740596D|nr:hypothetical protein [Parvularcula sp. IMCC14364]
MKLIHIIFALLMALCMACTPDRPNAVDQDAVFTGGNWGGSGHWRTCKETEQPNQYVCTEQWSDGSISRAGIYFHLTEDALPLNQATELPSGWAIYYKSERPYYMLAVVQPNDQKKVTYMALRPQECISAIIQQEPEKVQSLSERKVENFAEVSLDAYESIKIELTFGVLSRLQLAPLSYGDYRVNPNSYDYCEMFFQYP